MRHQDGLEPDACAPASRSTRLAARAEGMLPRAPMRARSPSDGPRAWRAQVHTRRAHQHGEAGRLAARRRAGIPALWRDGAGGAHPPHVRHHDRGAGTGRLPSPARKRRRSATEPLFGRGSVLQTDAVQPRGHARVRRSAGDRFDETRGAGGVTRARADGRGALRTKRSGSYWRARSRSTAPPCPASRRVRLVRGKGRYVSASYWRARRRFAARAAPPLLPRACSPRSKIDVWYSQKYTTLKSVLHEAWSGLRRPGLLAPRR